MPKESSLGVEYIAALLDYYEERRDHWLIFEVGGSPLSKCLYEVKGEFVKSERIYRID